VLGRLRRLAEDEGSEVGGRPSVKLGVGRSLEMMLGLVRRSGCGTASKAKSRSSALSRGRDAVLREAPARLDVCNGGDVFLRCERAGERLTLARRDSRNGKPLRRRDTRSWAVALRAGDGVRELAAESGVSEVESGGSRTTVGTALDRDDVSALLDSRKEDDGDDENDLSVGAESCGEEDGGSAEEWSAVKLLSRSSAAKGDEDGGMSRRRTAVGLERAGR
jgi:hypothetical protein